MSTLSAALGASVGHLQAITQRIESQLSFARQLVQWHPKNAAAWNKLIAQAESIATSAAQQGSREALQSAAKECEQILQPLAKTAKSYTIHCVGHAHIDMNWMWSWPETVAVTNDTFTTVLKLMDEFPDFRFTQSQASVYRIIEEHNPALLEQIRERVKEGRWEVTASTGSRATRTWPPANPRPPPALHPPVHGGALRPEARGRPDRLVARHLRPPRHHPRSTSPAAACKYHYLHRPGGMAKPRAFWWEAPDGSRVLVRNDMKRRLQRHHRPRHASARCIDFRKRHRPAGYAVRLRRRRPRRRPHPPRPDPRHRDERLADLPQHPARHRHEFFRRLEKRRRQAARRSTAN